MIFDLGTGWREWIEVRRGNVVQHCTSRADLLQLLQRHGLRYADFAEAGTVEEGCE